jgi:sortase A
VDPPGSSTAAVKTTGGPGRLRIAGTVLTVAGLLLLCGLAFEFGISDLIAQHGQQSLLPVFKAEAATTRLGAPSVTSAEGSPVAILRIQRLGLTQLVVEGSSPTDLESGPGHLSVSPMPGEFGNSVLLGRRTTYGAPLRDLNRLRAGDHIEVTTGQGTFTYIVTAVGSVSSEDVSPLSGTLDSRLTVVTSDPAYLFTGRLVAVAMLQGQPVAVPTRTPPAVKASDLGLASDPVWLAPAFLLLQLLIAAIWLSGRMRRLYWPASVTYMFAGPVVVALTMATVMILDRALPGTM